MQCTYLRGYPVPRLLPVPELAGRFLLGRPLFMKSTCSRHAQHHTMHTQHHVQGNKLVILWIRPIIINKCRETF